MSVAMRCVALGPDTATPIVVSQSSQTGDAADGFLVYSFAGDDPILCRDHVRTKLGLPPFEPKKKNGKAGAGAAWTMFAQHGYRDEHGAPYLLV